MPEARLSHYVLLDRIGEGGMGTVFRARDERLGRTVAIKTLRDGGLADEEQRRRFIQEAQAASSLNHPNIVTVHDIGRDGEQGLDFIAMEYVEGESVAVLLARGESGVDLALRIGRPVASALAAAHAAGIVHRDLKPGNVMQTASGAVKLLDFGLAKLGEPPRAEGDASTRELAARVDSPRTATGMVVGTPAYMAPEQIEGRPVDARTDVFALGLLLQELLTGRRAFRAGSDLALLGAILRDRPAPVRSHCPDCPVAMLNLVARCLEKDPGRRPQDAGEVLGALERIAADWQRRHTLGFRLAQPRYWLSALGIVLALAAALGYPWWSRQQAAARFAADLGSLKALAEGERRVEAFTLLRELETRAPGDARLVPFWNDLTITSEISTQPPGAQLWIKPYSRPDSPWIHFGESAAGPQRALLAHLRWRVELHGFETLELASRGDLGSVLLSPLGSRPEGMLWVTGGDFAFATLKPARLEGFWLDRTEVTNAQYQRFVDAGGYALPEFWQESMREDGRELSFEEAMARFRDSTGRPGPASWELGRYPDGKGDHPVTGVSWFEAMAYARFAGRTLPTAHHWLRAADHDLMADILRFANFDGEGAAAVATREALSRFGHHDLAGNVAEWVATGDASHRLTLGGHWASSPYLFSDLDGADPMLRSPHVGFRCARFEGAVADELLLRPLRPQVAFPDPVEDQVYAAYARLYQHEPLRGEARLLSTAEAEHWRSEDWELPADYGEQRFRLRVFLPRNAAPPYQLVVFGPPSTALFIPDLDQAGTREFAFLLRQGRAVAMPAYYGTFERRLPVNASAQARRSMRAHWSRDAGVALDFLVAREDIDAKRIAYYGFSLGANAGISMLAVEPRFALGILQATGLHPVRTVPEYDPLNFAPRVRQPVLMIGGRHDFQLPLKTSQEPLFERLGTAPEDKRLHLFDGGHVPPRPQEVMGVVLDWLDERLGPVAAGTSGQASRP
jgi:eukaryotic-like serine/threonine-protein kinase